MEQNNINHKCFISFKTEDIYYKNELVKKLKDQAIDKSLSEPINSEDEDYIMRKIREDHLSDSSVTIFLIGKHSSEKETYDSKRYIKRELQASLYDNTRNGILGVVLPEMTDSIYKGNYICAECGCSHNCVNISDSTVIKEFSVNYYIENPKSGCSWSEDDRYCVLVRWDVFIDNPQEYINQAFNKRSQRISNKVKVYPK